jgi:cytochrome c2
VKYPPRPWIARIGECLSRLTNVPTRGIQKVFLFFIYTGGVALVGIVLGMWFQQNNALARIFFRLGIDQSALRQYFDTSVSAQVARWKEVNTNLHVIEVAAFKISEATILGGSLAEVGGNLVIASPHGQLSYMDAGDRFHALDMRVPMNIEALRNDPLYKDPMFNIAYVRTYDLLAVRTSAETYDLYASFSRFAGRCFEFVVSRIALEVSDKNVRPISDWRDVWTAKPCVPLKSRGERFVGEEAGGRMVRYGSDTILVSVGDHQFDGFYDSQAVAMDPASDLGKLVEVNIKTGASRHFAVGLRNPQGLAIAPDGRIWETEHGPQGGDEVNLMIEGRNYGWPIVTYGMAYGNPPKNWPANPKAGSHDGYTRPRYAFVPLIGIGNLLVPDSREFPNWAGSLLLCSLRANTLYVLKTEGDDIVYAEPIPMDRYRLRDIAILPDGRLAILADGGSLLLVRNAEAHRDEAQQVEVTSSLPHPAPDEALHIVTGTAVERGRRYFQATCAACHSLTGEVGIGPPLNGIVGRRIAAVPRFGYSTALEARSDIWTEDLISSFVNNPTGTVPGTSMPRTGIYVDQAADVVAYLKTTREP